jgi:hypothetical protein
MKESSMTEREALFLRGGCRPFVYRPRGEKEWRLGWALPGLDVRVFLRQRLEPPQPGHHPLEKSPTEAALTKSQQKTVR